jgi:hypothetical protein
MIDARKSRINENENIIQLKQLIKYPLAFTSTAGTRVAIRLARACRQEGSATTKNVECLVVCVKAVAT